MGRAVRTVDPVATVREAAMGATQTLGSLAASDKPAMVETAAAAAWAEEVAMVKTAATPLSFGWLAASTPSIASR